MSQLYLVHMRYTFGADEGEQSAKSEPGHRERLADMIDKCLVITLKVQHDPSGVGQEMLSWGARRITPDAA